MEPVDNSRISLWIESQRAIAHSRHQDTQDSDKSDCPYHTLQAITPPLSVPNSTWRNSRHSVLATDRSFSPRKRPRGPADDRGFSPSRNVTILENRTVLSASSRESNSSPKRDYSPTRDHAIELRTASPSIHTDSIIGVDIPKRVRELRKLLINGFGRCFVPAGLKPTISSDPILVEEIDDDAYDEMDPRTPNELQDLFQSMQVVVANARDCEQNHRDENAWCMDVVQPLLRLALKETRSGEWLLQSVQSQRIQTSLLSRTASNSLIERKTDYALSYSHKDLPTSELYASLGRNGIRDCLGHTTDSFTKRTVLFSGIEVKPSDGSHAQAELQLSVWLAASLRHKARLVETAERFADITVEEETDSDGIAVFPEPGATIVGHDHQIYYAWIDADENTTNLGPDDRLSASTRSIRGGFLLLDLYKRILRYGSSGGQYKNWLFEEVLQRLVNKVDLEL